MATLEISGRNGFKGTELLVNTCYCSRDFTEAEVTKIITELRKKDNIRLEQQFQDKDPIYITKDGTKVIKLGKEFYTLDRKTKIKDANVIVGIVKYKIEKTNFDDLGITIFQSKRIEKIQTNDANLKTFTKELNKTLKAFTINSCIRKIHFLAQIYVESGRFADTYEGLKTVPSNYQGGVDFQGRGLKQITHDMNYLEYYDKINSTTLFKDKFKGRNNVGEGLTKYMARVPQHGFPDGFLETLKAFAKKLSTELYYAFDSSGWFWDSRKINNVADSDNVTAVTKLINGGDRGLSERKKYTSDLKTIFNYEKCINKK
jgi:predicted chitinase